MGHQLHNDQKVFQHVLQKRQQQINVYCIRRIHETISVAQHLEQLHQNECDRLN